MLKRASNFALPVLMVLGANAVQAQTPKRSLITAATEENSRVSLPATRARKQTLRTIVAASRIRPSWITCFSYCNGLRNWNRRW